MKCVHSHILLAIMAFLSLICCGRKDAPKLKTVFYESRQYIPLAKDILCDEYFSYAIKAEFPDSICGAESQDSVKAMKMKLMKAMFGDQAVKDCQDRNMSGLFRSIMAVHEQSYKKDNLRLWQSGRKGDLSRKETAEIFNISSYKEVASFLIYHTLDDGRTGEEKFEKGLNFDLRTGKEVKEENLFKGRHWKVYLEDKLREKAFEQLDSELVSSVPDSAICANGNFIFKKGNLIYLYNKDLTPQSDELVRVSIPLKELKRILK